MPLKDKSTVILLSIALLALRAGCEEILKSNNPDIGSMNFMELCQAFNQTCEEHDVTTEDGYILTVHRIRGDETRPVLLWHGILDSSDTYLLRGLDSTGASLAAAGHDVWVGNSRGNKYSRRHKTLSPFWNKKRFWDFSFHEMAYYDMAATIDFVLDKTGQKKLSAVGHSQGTTMFYILGSTRPAYNDKVKLFISMAPIAYLTHVRPLTRDLIPLWPAVNEILSTTGTYEVLGDRSAATKLMQLICSQGPVGYQLCQDDVAMSIAGSDPDEIEPEFFEVILKHYPAGTSTKDVTHFTQTFNKKRFAHYDNGILGNLISYGAVSPPDYDLSQVTAPVALLCAENDNLSTLDDVELLRSKLSNVVDYHVMARKQFNHINYIWGKSIDTDVNPLLKGLLIKYQ